MSLSSSTVREGPEEEENDESQVRFLPSQPLHHDEVASAGEVVSQAPSLPLPLSVLYGLNGVTLALPVTALMYIVNTRAKIPVAYLSAYGAVAFLPFSLKPFYAYLTDYHVNTKHLLDILLLASGLTVAGTALIPRSGILWCFVLAFLRGLCSAWAEFLLGLGLIRNAQETSNYEQAASLFQSQAATARNIGSFFANAVAFLLFALRHYNHSSSSEEEETELNDVMVTILLVATAILNASGALIAYFYPVSGVSKTTDRIRVRHDEPEDAEVILQRVESCHCATDDSSAFFSNVRSGQCRSLVLFQVVVIILAMRGPMISILSVAAWRISFTLFAIVLLWSVTTMPIPWKRAYRVGLFLILRHAVPKSTYLVDSYIYSLFQSTPMILQLVSVCSMGVSVVSAWSYGKMLARFSDGRRLVMVIVGTTIVASLLSLCNLTLLFVSGVSTMSVLILLAVNAVVSFSSEWRFLPDVILATTTVGSYNANENVFINDERTANEITAKDRDTSGIEYGTLISCIDFGGQIGSWAVVPLISALGISRENDWQNLDVMVVATALCGLASAGLVCLLRDQGGNVR